MSAVLLNLKEETFCQELARGVTFRRAAINAGYVVNASISHTAGRLVRQGHIQARVREIMATQFEQANITAARVKRELARIAFADIRDLYDDAGNLIPPNLLDDDTAALVSRIDVETRWEGRGDAAEPVTTKKIRLHDKMAALSILARHFKLVGEETEGVNALANALADRLKAARRRVDNVEDVEIIEPAGLPAPNAGETDVLVGPQQTQQPQAVAQAVEGERDDERLW